MSKRSRGELDNLAVSTPGDDVAEMKDAPLCDGSIALPPWAMPIGTMLAWCSNTIFIGARLPQIVTNWRRQVHMWPYSTHTLFASPLLALLALSLTVENCAASPRYLHLPASSWCKVKPSFISVCMSTKVVRAATRLLTLLRCLPASPSKDSRC